MKRETAQNIDGKYVKWMWIEVFLLLLNILLSVIMDINRLEAISVVNISFDWMAMFILIIMLNSCIRGGKTKGSVSFMNLSIMIFFILFFEVGTWSVDGLKDLKAINYLCNITSNSLMLISTGGYIKYMWASLSITEQGETKKKLGVNLIIAIGIAAEVLNCWCGYFYVIDENGTYISNLPGVVIGYIPFVCLFGYSCFIVAKQKISLWMKINYMIYAIVPVVISIWYNSTGLPPTLFMGAFISLMIIYGNIYIRQGREIQLSAIENARKDAEIAWQRNQLTRSQIRPHFIFNCLGSIEQLCRTDADAARTAIHRFAKYLRVNMDAMNEQPLIAFSQELEHIRNYVWLEQMRFEDDLKYEENIEAEDFYLPPLSVQPLVENAIKHGMMGKAEGVLRVKLKTRVIEDFYEILIEDNGSGFDVNLEKEDGRSHIGIQNVRDSLEQMVKGRVIIKSELNKGTQVTIRIPRDMNED